MVERSGYSEARAKDFVSSFEGPITASISRPGSGYLRYLDSPEGSGSFLTRNEFFSPVDARKGLNLDPAFTRNLATTRQTVTSTERSIIFEGNVRGGSPGVQQILAPNKATFEFGPGYRYY